MFDREIPAQGSKAAYYAPVLAMGPVFNRFLGRTERRVQRSIVAVVLAGDGQRPAGQLTDFDVVVGHA